MEELATSGVRIVLATARGPQAVGLIAGQLSFSPPLASFCGGWIGELDSQSLLPINVLLDQGYVVRADPNRELHGRTRDEIYRLIDSQLKDAHPLLEIEWRCEDDDRGCPFQSA